MKLRQTRHMNTHNALTRLTQFRQAVYRHFDLCADMLMDLVEALCMIGPVVKTTDGRK